MLISVLLKKKAKAMPKSSFDALTRELTKRLSTRYEHVEVIVKTASNDGLSFLRSASKEGDKTYVQEVLQKVWEIADDWFKR
ncbi:TPA: DinI-like family protein [Enterobacter asburiae]|nr:DinI-like family protein [Enterobacter asburiae]